MALMKARRDAILAERVRRILLSRGRPLSISDIVPIDDVERAYIIAVLHMCRGNQSLAARRLGIGRNTLRRRILSLRLRLLVRDIRLERRRGAEQARAVRRPARAPRRPPRRSRVRRRRRTRR